MLIFLHHHHVPGTQLDVTNPSDIQAVVESVEQLRKKWNVKLAGVVGNAGLGFHAPVENHHMNDIRRLFDVNFFGNVALSQAFMPLIREDKVRGEGNTPGWWVFDSLRFDSIRLDNQVAILTMTKYNPKQNQPSLLSQPHPGAARLHKQPGRAHHAAQGGHLRGIQVGAREPGRRPPPGALPSPSLGLLGGAGLRRHAHPRQGPLSVDMVWACVQSIN
jgi:NAD(P)-dependent dehydrogenase (short-subunit alcohol dehydrogenase family)